MQNHTEHKIKEDATTPAHGVSDTIGYAWGGKEVEVHSPECLAKKGKDLVSGRMKYWIKRSTLGSTQGQMINPLEVDFVPESKLRKNYTGLAQYEFRVANEETFNLYLRFISTQNPMYLKQAERSVNL